MLDRVPFFSGGDTELTAAALSLARLSALSVLRCAARSL